MRKNRAMEDCAICSQGLPEDNYLVNCGSTVPHRMCHGCEFEWRKRMTPTSTGRAMSCPMCRVVEPRPGNRSVASLTKELALMYQKQYARITTTGWIHRDRLTPAQSEQIVQAFGAPGNSFPYRLSPSATATPVARATLSTGRPVGRVSRPKVRCESGNTPCPTRSPTTRICKYPMGCTKHVCRACNMCVSHFVF